jgi:phosphatidate cytidylyltransferase
MPLVLGAVFCAKPWPLLALALFSCWIGWAELSAMAGISKPAKALGVGIGTCLVGWAALFPLDGGLNSMSAPAIAVALAIGCFSAVRSVKHNPAPWFAFTGSLWIAAALAAAMGLHGRSLAGTWWNFRPALFLVLLPLWAGDSAAIFVGKAWGRHLFAPSISPNKTVEGALANLAACVLLAWGVGTWVRCSMPTALCAGLICGVFGQAGDLFESVLKRSAGVKDSGSLLPGHGGLLDRIDSFLFCAPLVLVLLAFAR